MSWGDVVFFGAIAGVGYIVTVGLLNLRKSRPAAQSENASASEQRSRSAAGQEPGLPGGGRLAEFERICRQCSQSNSPDSRFCRACGGPLA